MIHNQSRGKTIQDANRFVVLVLLCCKRSPGFIHDQRSTCISPCGYESKYVVESRPRDEGFELFGDGHGTPTLMSMRG